MHRTPEYQALFVEARDQYLKRLKGEYDGPCLDVALDTLDSLADIFSWDAEKKPAAERGEDEESDCGEQRRVDKEGKSRAAKRAEYHFNLKSVLRGEGAGRGATGPTAYTFNPPSKAGSSSSSSSSAAAGNKARTGNASTLSPSKRATGKGRRVIGTGPKNRFIIFRHKNPMLQRAMGFPVMLGEVVGVNERPDDVAGWKGRPDGSIDPKTGELYKEKWMWAVKFWALRMTVNDNLSKTPDIRKAAWWSPNYIVEYERSTNHNHIFMDTKTAEKIQQKYVKKAAKGGKAHSHSTLYVDFDNPDHGLVLLDDNAEFTKSQSLMSKHCLKCLVRKDATVRKEMDKFAQDKLKELEMKKGPKKNRGVDAPAAEGTTGDPAAEGNPESYSPFLALCDGKEATESDGTEVGGIFENESEDEEGRKDAAEAGLMVAAFIDRVNGAQNDEELDDQEKGVECDGDTEESSGPEDVVFVGGRPPPSSSSSSSSSVLAIQNAQPDKSEKVKKKGRPLGAKNVAKKKKKD